MHTKRYKWMVALAVFFGLGIIGAFADLKTLSIGPLLLMIILTALFIFLAWKFKDERRCCA